MPEGPMRTRRQANTEIWLHWIANYPGYRRLLDEQGYADYMNLVEYYMWDIWGIHTCATMLNTLYWESKVRQDRRLRGLA